MNDNEPVKNVCITLPPRILDELDLVRGDVSRSRYILRLIEKDIAK